MSDETPVLAKRKAGRPRYAPPENFAEAVERLSPPRAEFVRGIVAGLTQAAAYRAAYPCANENTAATEGRALMKKRDVSTAVNLGKSEMASQLIERTGYDLQAAHAEIDRHIAGAVENGQYTAVASLIREKLKMFKLTDTRDVSAAAGFIFKIEGVGDAHVIEAKPAGADEGGEDVEESAD